MNKRNIKKIRVICLIIVLLIIFVFGCFKLIQFLRVKFARIEVTLVDDLNVEFTSEKKISDFITSINGTILDDYVIDTNSIGEKNLIVNFINDDGIKVHYDFNVNVVDTVAPVIWLGGSYSIQKGDDSDFKSKILCGDNEDANPNCYIEGEYDYNTAGSYPLLFKATDKSGNTSEKEFTLYVKEPSKGSSSSNNTKTYTDFNDVISNYKNEKTKIGIDVSGWQGDIDFDALKNAGVEFIIIRVGGTRGTGKEYFVDSKFEQNIKEANEHDIDVGIYFYSYANTNELARQDALWVIEQIKDYKVTLPIAFDWENWSSFNDYNLSFFGLTDMANTFLDTISEAGYKGLLYSSKSYLEKLWLPTEYDIWLAHYTNKTNYQGDYTFWQICSDGRVDGIEGDVDIDIMYLN